MYFKQIFSQRRRQGCFWTKHPIKKEYRNCLQIIVTYSQCVRRLSSSRSIQDGVGSCVGCGREGGCTLTELLRNLLIYQTRATFLTRHNPQKSDHHTATVRRTKRLAQRTRTLILHFTSSENFLVKTWTEQETKIKCQGRENSWLSVHYLKLLTTNDKGGKWYDLGPSDGKNPHCI